MDELKSIKRMTHESPLRDDDTILVQGNMGSGKTIAIGTLTPFGMVEVIDCDGQARKLRTLPESFGVVQENLVIWDVCKQQTPQGETDWVQAYKDVDVLMLDLCRREEPPFAVVLDTTTTLKEICLNYVRVTNSTPLGKTELQHYNYSKEHLERFLRRFMMIRSVRVVNCHLATEKDEVTGKIYSAPDVPGQLARDLPTKFSNVLIAEAFGSKEARKWQFITTGDDRTGARTSRILKSLIPPDFGIVLGKKGRSK